jgi:hypothetical protein
VNDYVGKAQKRLKGLLDGVKNGLTEIKASKSALSKSSSTSLSKSTPKKK